MGLPEATGIWWPESVLSAEVWWGQRWVTAFQGLAHVLVSLFPVSETSAPRFLCVKDADGPRIGPNTKLF